MTISEQIDIIAGLDQKILLEALAKREDITMTPKFKMSDDPADNSTAVGVFLWAVRGVQK